MAWRRLSKQLARDGEHLAQWGRVLGSSTQRGAQAEIWKQAGRVSLEDRKKTSWTKQRVLSVPGERQRRTGREVVV